MTPNEGQLVEGEGRQTSVGVLPRHRSAARKPAIDMGHWTQMYTDPEYFRDKMTEAQSSAAPFQTDQGQAFWKRQANISYLSQLTGTMPSDMAEVYEARKSQMARAINGTTTISDEGVFDYFKEQFEVQNQRQQTAGDIFTEVMREGVQQSFDGKPVNHVPLLSKLLDQAGDMFSDDERTKLREEIDDTMNTVAAIQDAIAPEAKWIFDMMATQTGRKDATVDGETAGFYFEESINRFAAMERPERERIYELVRAFAELSGDPKGWFQTLGEQFSRGLSDIYERVPRNWREGDLYKVKQQIQSGQPLMVSENDKGELTYMLTPFTTSGDMGELGAVAVEQAMRRSFGEGRQATSEEAKEFEQELDQKIAALTVERELRDLAQSGVDPSGQSRDPRWWKQILDEGLWSSARSVPYTALAGMPFGLGLLGVGNALYAQNMDQLALDYPDLPYEKRAALAAFSAPIEAVTERIKWLTVTGKLPLTGRLFRHLNHPKRGPFTRILFGFGLINVEQNVQEIIQENTLPFFQTLANALIEDMPEYNWKERFEGMPRELAVQFVALFPLTLMGGGALTFREMKRGESYIKTQQHLLEMGMDQPAIDRIVSALTPEESQNALIEEEAKLTDEQRLKGYERIIERVMAGQAKEPDVAGPRIVKNSKEPNNYDVLDRDGNPVAEGVTADEAVEAHRAMTARRHIQMEEVQQRLIDYFLENAEQRKAAGLDGDLDTVIEIISREAMKELEDMTPEQWSERIRQWEIEHGVSAEGLNFSVIGRNDLEQISETMFRSVSRLVRARSPEQVLRVIEEVAEGNLKMMWRRGSYTRQQVFEHLKQYELYSGESLNLPEAWSDTINDQLLTEAFSTLAVAYFTKQIDRGTLPEMIASFLRVIGEFIAATLVRAENIIAGLESGKIDPAFEIALAASVGLNPDMRVENRAESKRQAVAAGQPIDPNQPLPAASFAVTVNVAPVRTDRLDKMTKGEVMKRAKSPKFIHLQQIVTEVAAAYGVPISARYPVIGGWTEDGRPSLEVPESIIFETNDFAMANEMAALIAITAPELQNAAFVWQYDATGPHAEYRFQAANAKVAYELAQQLEDGGVQGFSYDPKTRQFSVVAMGDADTFEAKLYEFISEQSKQGRVGSRGRVTKAVGESSFPGEAEYKDAIAAARVRAGTAEAGRGEALRAIADRAQRRLDRSEAAKRTAEQAKAVLQSLAQPRMSASRIQAELKGRQFDNIRALGLWLDERFRRQVKKSVFDIGSKDGLENASNALVYDVLDGLATDGSGMGWYDERVQETLRELAALHPEFNDNPFALAVYIGILAATSQGYTVMQNFQQADRVYADYKRTGRIPESYKFAQSSPAINGNLQLINQLIDQYGIEGYTEFMDSEVTGRAIRDQYGLKAAGVTLAQVTRGNAVFGQKIGSFFNNLRGRFDTITMDLWYTRTMHRYLGETLVPLNTPKLQTALKKLRAELKKPGVRTYGVDIEKAMQDDEYAVQAGMRIMQKWGAGKNKYSEAGYFKFPDGYAIEKAARRVNALGGMKGAPQNKSHRNYFADIVRASKAKLDAMGIVLTEADIQAIIWYREKNLFATVGRANIAAKPADYLDAAMGLKRTRGAETTFAISPDPADFLRRIDELQEGESSPVDTSKTFWLIASSSGDIVDILGNEQDATTYFQTMASAGEWLWEYKDGLRTQDPLLKRGVAERRAEGYIDTVRYEQDEAQGRTLYYGADTSPETPASAGEIPSYTPDGRLWQGQNESVVYHGGRNLDPQGTDAGGYGATQTLQPRDPLQTYSFAISPDEKLPNIGINVNAGSQNYTDKILDGSKTIETRDTDSLRPYVGRRVGIVRTGAGPATLVGYMNIEEPTVYQSEAQFRSDEARHRVPAGDEFDIKKGGIKYGYPVSNVEAVAPEQLASRGIVARKLPNGTFAISPESIVPGGEMRDDRGMLPIKRGDQIVRVGIWSEGGDNRERMSKTATVYVTTPLLLTTLGKEQGTAKNEKTGFIQKRIYRDRLNLAVYSEDAISNPRASRQGETYVRADDAAGIVKAIDFFKRTLVANAKQSIDIDDRYNRGGSFSYNYFQSLVAEGVDAVDVRLKEIVSEYSTNDLGPYQAPQNDPRKNNDNSTFAISPDQYYGDIEAAVAALDADPAFRRERVAGVLARFKALKRQFESKDERLDVVEAVADLEAIISLLPPEARAKISGFRKLASFKTPKGRLNYLINRINEADKVLEEYLRREFIHDIETLIERALPRTGDNKVQISRVGVAATETAQMADRIISMTSEEVANRMNEIEAALEAAGTDADQQAKLLEEWGLLNTLGDLYKRSAGELDAARTYLRQSFGAGRAMWRIMEEARRDEQRAMADELADQLKEATPQTLKERDPGQNLLKRFVEWSKGFLLSHWSFQQLLRTYLPDTSFTIDWADRLRRADIAATRYATDAGLRLLAAIGQAIGSRKGRDIGRAYYQMRVVQKAVVRVIAGRQVKMERISIDLATALLEGTASAKEAGLSKKDLAAIKEAVMAVPLMNERNDSRGQPYLIANRTRYVEWERVLKEGTEENLDMSPAEAVQFLLSWEQEAVRERMERQGWTEKSVADMRVLVAKTPGTKEAMEFLMQEYERGGDAADPVYMRMYGMRMPRIENYAPTKYMNRDDSADLSPFGAMGQISGTTPGPLKSRVKHDALMRQVDAFTVFSQHVVQMGHWINFAEIIREIRSVLKAPRTRANMEATFGRNIVQIYDNWIESLANRGAARGVELGVDNQFLNMLIAGKSISSLGGNLRTVFMQVDAGMRMMFEMPIKDVAKAMANPAQLLADLPMAWHSDTVQRRIIEGTSPEIRFIFESARIKPTEMLRLSTFAMMPMVYTDTVLTTTVAAMVYRYHYQQAKAAGLRDADAELVAADKMGKAVYNFAQPIDITSRSLREISGNKAVKTFMMFQSDMRLKTSMWMEGFYGLSKDPVGQATAALEKAKETLATAKRDGDATAIEAAEANLRAKRAKVPEATAKRNQYIQNIFGVWLAAMMMHTLSNAFRDWFSDEPDEDIWTWEGYAKASMLAPFSGLFLVGAAADVGLSKLWKTMYFTGSTNPLVTSTEQMTRALGNMDKTFDFDNPEELVKQWNRIARAASMFGPKSAAPAAVINALKPIEGAYRNAQSPEEREPKTNLNRW